MVQLCKLAITTGYSISISGLITGYNCIHKVLFLLGRFSDAGFDVSTVVYGEITGARSTASPGPTARPVDTQGKI